MSSQANSISSKITYAQMAKNGELDFKSLRVKDGYRFGLYDKDKKPVLNYIKHKVDFSKKFYKDKEGHLGVIDRSVFGHMGIEYVVVEENSFLKEIDNLKKKLFLAFLVIFLFISIIGYFLSKLFIKPIQNEREKLDRFIKDSTHELNTPITALLLSTSSPDPTNPKNLERIRLSAIRISKLYDDLTYSILKNKKELKIQKLDIDKLLAEEIKTMQPFADKKSITIKTEIESFSFEIDKESAKRLLSNIISNAIKYTKRGGKIEITLKNKTLIVKDNGIGIEEEKIKSIFDRYYRATKFEGGFGIGLSMVSDICKKYNLKLDVKSKIGKGSEFIIRF